MTEELKLVIAIIGMLGTAAGTIAGAAYVTGRVITQLKEHVSAIEIAAKSLGEDNKKLDWSVLEVAREATHLKERCALLEQSREFGAQASKDLEARFEKTIDTAVGSLRREMSVGFESLRSLLLDRRDAE